MNQGSGQKSKQTNSQRMNELSQGNAQQTPQGGPQFEKESSQMMMAHNQWSQNNNSGHGQMCANEPIQTNQFLPLPQTMHYEYMQQPTQPQPMSNQNVLGQTPSMVNITMGSQQLADEQLNNHSQHQSQMMSQQNQMSQQFNQGSFHQNSNSKGTFNTQLLMPDPTFGNGNQQIPMQEFLPQNQDLDQNNASQSMSNQNNTPILQTKSAPQLAGSAEPKEQQAFNQKSQFQETIQQQNIAVANSHILESGEEAEQERMDSSVGDSQKESQENMLIDEPNDDDQNFHQTLQQEAIESKESISQNSVDSKVEAQEQAEQSFHTAIEKNYSQKVMSQKSVSKQSSSKRSQVSKSSRKSSIRGGNDDVFKSAEKPNKEDSYEGPIPIPPVVKKGSMKKSVICLQSDLMLAQIQETSIGKGRRGKQSVKLPKEQPSQQSDEPIEQGKRVTRSRGRGRGNSVRGRGRPSKISQQESLNFQDINSVQESNEAQTVVTKSRRGRKPKNQTSEGRASKATPSTKRRGRPRKIVEQIIEEPSSDEQSVKISEQNNQPLPSEEFELINKTEAQEAEDVKDAIMSQDQQSIQDPLLSQPDDQSKQEECNTSEKQSSQKIKSDQQNKEIPVESSSEIENQQPDSDEEMDELPNQENDNDQADASKDDEDQTLQEESTDKQLAEAQSEGQKSHDEEEQKEDDQIEQVQTVSNPTDEEPEQPSQQNEDLKDKQSEEHESQSEKEDKVEDISSSDEKDEDEQDVEVSDQEESADKSSDGQEVIPPHLLEAEDQEMEQQSSESEDDNQKSGKTKDNVEQELNQQKSSSEELEDDVCMKYSDKPEDQEKSVDSFKDAIGDENIQEQVDESGIKVANKIEVSENDDESAEEEASALQKSDEEIGLKEIEEAANADIDDNIIGDDAEEEEGEYFPNSSSEISEDHEIDENVESEQIAIQEQHSSDQILPGIPAIQAVNKEESEEDKPGDKSSEEDQIMELTQKTFQSRKSAKQNENILQTQSQRSGKSPQVISKTRSAVKQSQVSRKSVSPIEKQQSVKRTPVRPDSPQPLPIQATIVKSVLVPKQKETLPPKILSRRCKQQQPVEQTIENKLPSKPTKKASVPKKEKAKAPVEPSPEPIIKSMGRGKPRKVTPEKPKSMPLRRAAKAPEVQKPSKKEEKPPQKEAIKKKTKKSEPQPKQSPVPLKKKAEKIQKIAQPLVEELPRLRGSRLRKESPQSQVKVSKAKSAQQKVAAEDIVMMESKKPESKQSKVVKQLSKSKEPVKKEMPKKEPKNEAVKQERKPSVKESAPSKPSKVEKPSSKPKKPTPVISPRKTRKSFIEPLKSERQPSFQKPTFVPVKARKVTPPLVEKKQPELKQQKKFTPGLIVKVVPQSAKISKSKSMKKFEKKSEVIELHKTSSGFGLGFSSPARETENESMSKRGRPRKFLVDESPKKPKVMKSEIQTKQVIEMILPMLQEIKENKLSTSLSKQSKDKPKKEDLQPKSIFGMIDEEFSWQTSPVKKVGRPSKPSPVLPQPYPFMKKRDIKADTKFVGKLGSKKLSKEKKAIQTEVSEPKPAKFQKKEKLGFGIKKTAPALFKPQDKRADKFKSLLGMKNPFDALKKNKTLIATPSKFEIRIEPEHVKKGRGRPRKDQSKEHGNAGIRNKLKNSKYKGESVGKVGRPPKSLDQKSKKIDKEKVKKIKETILKAKLKAKIQKKKDKHQQLKDLKKLKTQDKHRKLEDKKDKHRALKQVKKLVKLEKMEKLKALIKQKKDKVKQKKLKAQNAAKKASKQQPGVEKRGRPKKTLTITPKKEANKPLVGQKRSYSKSEKQSKTDKGKKSKK